MEPKLQVLYGFILVDIGQLLYVLQPKGQNAILAIKHGTIVPALS